MKVLSFDVGIKNLAYCVIDYGAADGGVADGGVADGGAADGGADDGGADEHRILDWGILNISAEPVCEHQMKDRQCDATAKFTIGQVCLCPSHRKLKMYRDQKAKKVPKLKNPTLAVGKNIVTLLDEKSLFLEVDAVLIENQPALKNPTMKSIQMMVYTYFLVKGITVTENPMVSLEMINARNKLKAYKGPPIPCDFTDKYKKTKYLGVHSCAHMIQENPEISEEWLTLYAGSKKKDDLADAYLQGMYWLTK